MEEKSLSQSIKGRSSFLLKFPLYTKVKVNTEITERNETKIISYDDEGVPFSINHTYFCENNDFKYLKAIIFKEKRIYGYCPFCEKELYLIHKGKEIEEQYRDDVLCMDTNIDSQEMYKDCIDYAEKKFVDRYSYLVETCIDYYRNFIINLECTSKHKHNIQIIFHLSEENYLIKIGQYPSIVDFERNNIKKYNKVLKEFSSEYYKAIFLRANDYGIASFTYLRRIFEGLLIDKMNDMVLKDDGFNKEEFLKLHIDEKIKELENELPSFLKDNKELYGVLSKGVHQLSDEECLKYFDVVKQVVEVILDEKIENKKKQKLKKDLGNIVNYLK